MAIAIALLAGCGQSGAPPDRAPASAPASEGPPPSASAPGSSLSRDPGKQEPKREPKNGSVKRNGRPRANGGPTANGGGKKPAPADGMAWNVWAEPDLGRAFKPAPFLKPNTQYRVSVDLAGLVYDARGVSVTPVSRPFTERVDQWRRDGFTEVPLQLVALHDPTVLDVLTPVQPAVVKVDRIGQPTGVASGADVFSEMRTAAQVGTEPKFLYSRSEFIVVTRATSGLTAVSFSVWINGTVPVEEFSSRFCIAGDDDEARALCGNTPITYTLSGIDSVRLAMEGAPPPDGAIHIIEMPRPGRTPQLMGVFKRNGSPGGTWRTWRLRSTDSGESIGKYLAQTVMPAFYKVSDQTALAAVGRGFYNVLFPANDPQLPDADAARADFEAFIAAYPQLTVATSAGQLAPSIFVRAVVPNLDLYLPLGLAHVGNQFIGFSFRVESPLPVQSFLPQTGCVTRWTMALPNPPIDTALDRAVAALQGRFGTPTGWNATTEFYREIGKLKEWLAKQERDLDRSAIVVTSHHDKDTLFFQGNDRIFSREIERLLAPGSVAVLNGCGTGEPGATDFIAELSRRGVAAVIATGTEVQGEMAGHFLDCLAGALENASGHQMKMAELHFASVQCLRARSPQQVGATPYGAQALSYLLLGNANLTLCSPRRTP